MTHKVNGDAFPFSLSVGKDNDLMLLVIAMGLFDNYVTLRLIPLFKRYPEGRKLRAFKILIAFHTFLMIIEKGVLGTKNSS